VRTDRTKHREDHLERFGARPEPSIRGSIRCHNVATTGVDSSRFARTREDAQAVISWCVEACCQKSHAITKLENRVFRVRIPTSPPLTRRRLVRGGEADSVTSRLAYGSPGMGANPCLRLVSDLLGSSLSARIPASPVKLALAVDLSFDRVHDWCSEYARWR
jgi:hypothetical protein